MNTTSTPFPSPHWRKTIANGLAERWEDLLDPAERIEVDGERRGPELSLRLALVHGSKSRRFEVETGVNASTLGLTEEQVLALLMDAADAILGEHLEGDRSAVLSADWSPVSYENHVLYARAKWRDPILEAEADELLSR